MKRVTCPRTECHGIENIKGLGEICEVINPRAEIKFSECPFYREKALQKEKVEALVSKNHKRYEEIAGVKKATVEQIRAWVIRAESRYPMTEDSYRMLSEISTITKHDYESFITGGEK